MPHRHPHNHRKLAHDVFTEAKNELDQILSAYVGETGLSEMHNFLAGYFEKLRATIEKPSDPSEAGHLRATRSALTAQVAAARRSIGGKFQGELEEFEATLRRNIRQAHNNREHETSIGA